jgi:hypothetical protein
MICAVSRLSRILVCAAFLFTFFYASGSFAEDSSSAEPKDTAQSENPRLENQAVGLTLSTSGSHLHDLRFHNRLDKQEFAIEEPFAILLKDGRVYNTRNLQIVDAPAWRELTPNPDAPRLADRLHGRQLDVSLQSEDGALQATWSAVLLEDSLYLRQVLTVKATGKDLPISRIELINLPLSNARVEGSVQGSPIISDNLYAGFEHPISESKVVRGQAKCWIERDLPLRADQSITYSSVIGVTRPGQFRRDFLGYLERERAHPYRTFLHPNSWYDLGYFTPYDESLALDHIRAFGTELSEKRGVKIDSYLFDDGWDNHKSLWKFNSGFPNGLVPIREGLAKYGAAPGIWMSPWGGYAEPHRERMDFGKAAGYEIVQDGYALSGPKYYAAFRDVCLEMVRKYGVNQFKFDGTGNVDSVFPGSQFDSDFSAAIHLIGELREAKPDLFINLTTGTWPSPFWLRFADSIWRGGEDDDFLGVGSYRERWITYRDADTYRRVVENGPLYPLNSLMLHGIIYAKSRKHLNDDPGNDFRNEVRDYFGTGTQLQEMYITPSLLSQQNWDDLAEAAKWSRANAEVLKDSHWVGGDPAWLQVYGWASWTPNKAILVLRNPSDKPQSIRLKLKDVLELPEAEASRKYMAKSPWKEDAGTSSLSIGAQDTHEFRLEPFQVMTLDIVPK